MLGIPTATVTQEEMGQLMKLTRDHPATKFVVDLERKTLLSGGKEHLKFDIHESKRNALVNGTWDSTSLLLANAGKTAEVAKSLPYVSGF